EWQMQREGPASEVAASEAVSMAAAAGMGRAEAVARRHRARCLLGAGRTAEATAELRHALLRQVAMGTALEAARTRLVLAEALTAGANTGGIPQEARAVLAE